MRRTLFQVGEGPLLRGDDLFPVPLVHIDGVDVVQILIGPEGIHVRVDAPAGSNAQFIQFQAFPFCQGVHDFGACLVHPLDGEGDRPLDAVQIVIDTGAAENDHGGRDAQQRQLGGQVHLEHVFDGFDGFFGILGRSKQVAVTAGQIE